MGMVVLEFLGFLVAVCMVVLGCCQEWWFQ